MRYIKTIVQEKYFLREIISKKLFKNKSIGKKLSAIVISDVLGIDYETIYNNIEILTEEISFSALTVNSVADVILDDNNDKMIIDIEINGYDGVIKRNQTLSYVCQLFLGQIKNKEDYLKIKKVLQINIDTRDFLGYNEFIYDIYLMDKVHHKIASNEIQIVHINLDYLRNLDYTIIKENELMKYLYFFVCGIEYLDEFVEKINGDKFMEKIVKEVKKISGEENVIPYVSEDEMREIENKYYKDLYHEEGRAIGREEKEREMIINLYNNGASLELISKSSGLSIKEIDRIIKEEQSE